MITLLNQKLNSMPVMVKISLSLSDQTRPRLLESCRRGGKVQRSHGLPELHQVWPGVPLWCRAHGRRHRDVTAVLGSDSALSTGRRVPNCPTQLGPAISLPAGTLQCHIVQSEVCMSFLIFWQALKQSVKAWSGRTDVMQQRTTWEMCFLNIKVYISI